MDSTDMAIVIQLTKGAPNQKATDVLVPLLVGTERLLHGDYIKGNGVPVIINKEKPYIEFKGAGAYIEISSNIAVK